MKYNEAKLIGEASCCYTAREIFDNIDFHAPSFFVYEKIGKELDELLNDMLSLGLIKLIDNPNHAMGKSIFWY